MSVHEKYMAACLKLATPGIRAAMPNPSVGAMIVHNQEIIGAGCTQPFGGNHAEVEAFNAISSSENLSDATLYVTLEPCSHHGNTPPCTDLIIQSGIKHVVIGSLDPNALVNGSGINRLQSSGINVEVGPMQAECELLNKRFYTFHQKKRPYIILKWAQTADGFIDKLRKNNEGGIHWITHPETKKITHQWRSEEAAIVIGTNTAINDNPNLTVRAASGTNPARIILDEDDKLPKNLSLFDGASRTIILSKKKLKSSKNYEVWNLNFDNFISEFNHALFTNEILSVIVEGGGQLLNSFLKQGVWDEARVLTGNTQFGAGLLAPKISSQPTSLEKFNDDEISYYIND
ncbi:MAG: bifunctional diaminohydroxyphosphoribosylaminopyrimidine deaminase/5-amino-6-(5-phosphoribosylamino)uracil reductase RibD [Flavobacteriales bacterium]|nr:bifunctional diaminohydroxyphosphoribosylaminopyrimidine deaminase/5-amino-6-(5-phosphoribosylamino)uracil reductase RibD [Flavobacteriales bacterium]